MDEPASIANISDHADDQISASPAEHDYWYALIPAPEAADFLKLTDRALAYYRQRGGGPRFVRVSSRCVRYRRIDLRAWTEARLASSTSDEVAA